MRGDTKIRQTTAGCIVVVCKMKEQPRRERGQGRAPKAKCSSPGQQRYNQVRRESALELLLAANFPTPGSALVVTLTYDDRHLPKNLKEAQKRLEYFREKINRERKKAGLPPARMIWCTEVNSSASGRWHHHLAIEATGSDYDMIRRCWIYGADIECEKLRVDDEKNHETLARYMSKEKREAQDYNAKPGTQAWSCSRNCKRPEVDVMAVDADRKIRPPRGATVLLHELKSTEFANYELYKWRLPFTAFKRAPRAKRRRFL